VTEKPILGLKLALQLEQVGDKHAERGAELEISPSMMR
jgi:hypothetical protein